MPMATESGRFMAPPYWHRGQTQVIEFGPASTHVLKVPWQRLAPAQRQLRSASHPAGTGSHAWMTAGPTGSRATHTWLAVSQLNVDPQGVDVLLAIHANMTGPSCCCSSTGTGTVTRHRTRIPEQPKH